MKRNVFSLILFMLVVGWTASAQAFSDVDGHWAELDITRFELKGLVNGFGDNTFRPDNFITRAEFTKLLVLSLDGGSAAGLLPLMPLPYSDVGLQDWENRYIAAATEQGIVQGYPDGTFKPGKWLSRSEAVTMIGRILDKRFALGGSDFDDAEGNSAEFFDSHLIPPWAKDFVKRAVKLGIIKGFEDGYFRPEQSLTRAEAVKMLSNTMSYLGTAFDLAGIVKEVDMITGSLTFLPWGSSKAQVINLPSSTTVFRNGRRASPKEILPLDEIFITFGASGQFFLEARFFGIGGQLVSVDDRKMVLVLRYGARDVAVSVLPQTLVFKEGKEAQLSQLAKGDRLFVVLDSLTGFARIVDAVRVDFSGTVRQVKGHQIEVVSRADDASWYSLVPETLTFINGIIASPLDVKPGDVVQAMTLQDGAVKYLEIRRD